jgi:hypothetical protein
MPHSVSVQPFLMATALKTLKLKTASVDATPTHPFMHRGNLFFNGFLNQYVTVHVLCAHLIINQYYI